MVSRSSSTSFRKAACERSDKDCALAERGVKYGAKNRAAAMIKPILVHNLSRTWLFMRISECNVRTDIYSKEIGNVVFSVP